MSATTDPRQTAEWDRAKREVLRRDQHRCQSCRRTEADWRGIDLQVHHIKRVEDGGANERSNLVVLCNRCHKSVHSRGPDEDGLYPASLASDRHSVFNDTSRDAYDPEGSQLEILRVLKQRGPTKREEILERAGLEVWEFQKAVDHLKFARFVGKVERGVYAYISRREFERAAEERRSSDGEESVMLHPFRPDEDGTFDNSNEFMGDRTTITVAPETKELLDDQRGDKTWDAFLRSVVESAEGDDEVKIGTGQVDEIARLAGKEAADELEARMR